MTIREWQGRQPLFAAGRQECYIDSAATLIGDVTVGKDTSFWPGAVARGDMAPIRVGEGASVQDNAVLHTAENHPLEIGNYVTIGHSAVLHGCTVEDNVLIGMGAIVLDGAVIGYGSIIGAGALIPENKVVAPGSLVVGIPGKPVRELSPAEIEGLHTHALEYVRLWRETYKA